MNNAMTADAPDRNNLTGAEVRSLMRSNGKTIRSLSEQMGIFMTRVRKVRADGVTGMAAIDWAEALTGGKVSHVGRGTYRIDTIPWLLA